MGKIIGIDLGTTNSAVSIISGENATAIANAEGDRTTPSIIALSKKNEWLVGKTAKRQAVMNPKKTLYAVKRLMGRKFNDPEVQKMRTHAPFEIVANTNGDAAVKIDDKIYSPPEISAKVLTKMKETAEAFLGEPVTQAIVTVPAYFNDSQRQATKDAGKIAGLEVLRIINEPTAAALSFGINKKDADQKVIVYDLGGGTFDVSVLELSGGVFEVKATNGDTFLGGEDFDARIMKHLIDEFKNDGVNNPAGVDLAGNQQALQRIKEAAEAAKIDLSSKTSTEINLPFIAMGPEGPLNLEINLTRAKLENLVGDLIQKTIEPCEKALKDAGLKLEDIDEVILVGGMTRMPKVIDTVRQVFKKEPNRGVNPDEVVANGAALQGGIISGEVKDVILLDVIPLSIGIETKGGVFTKMIERNTSIPCKKIEVFSTAKDNQTSVNVSIYQGERERASDNKLLGNFSLDGIPPAPKAVPQIEVTLDIDANGILKVSAMDQATKREQKITITANSGLTEKDIERAIKDAEANAEKDRSFKEMADTRNKSEMLIEETKKDVKQDYFLQLPDEIKTAFNEAVQGLEGAMKAKDVKLEDLKEKCETVEKIRSSLYEAFVKTQQAQQPTPATGDGPAAPGAAPKAGPASTPPTP